MVKTVHLIFIMYQIFFVNQTFSMMNKSVFKVKKSCGSTWSLWLSHNNSFASKAFLGHWRCSPCFIRLEILINFVGKKNCFYKRSYLES